MSAPKTDTDILPIFPLAGALLLPGGVLPLNIFEPRYLAMTQDALLSHRLIGMVQPNGETMPCGTPCVHKIGCAGKISEAIPTQDGRFLIELTGTRRFAIEEELSAPRGYRRVQVRWLDEPEVPVRLDRARLIPALKTYLEKRKLECAWEKLTCCQDANVLTLLAMLCPFTAAEQQALLEAPDAARRADLLLTLIELDGAGGPPN